MSLPCSRFSITHQCLLFGTDLKHIRNRIAGISLLKPQITGFFSAKPKSSLEDGRDRFPQRSCDYEANESADETPGSPVMVDHLLAIHTDRPEVDPCLRAIF